MDSDTLAEDDSTNFDSVYWMEGCCLAGVCAQYVLLARSERFHDSYPQPIRGPLRMQSVFRVHVSCLSHVLCDFGVVVPAICDPAGEN